MTAKQKTQRLTLEQELAVKFLDDGEPDHLWALDHSTRRFRVRPMRRGGCCDQYEYQIGHDIVVLDLQSTKWHGRGLVSFTEVTIDPFDSRNPTPGAYEDSDTWAIKVWRASGEAL